MNIDLICHLYTSCIILCHFDGRFNLRCVELKCLTLKLCAILFFAEYKLDVVSNDRRWLVCDSVIDWTSFDLDCGQLNAFPNAEPFAR